MPRAPWAWPQLLEHPAHPPLSPHAPQLAKALGASFVATTCSTRNVEFVTQELGADDACDYTRVGALGGWRLGLCPGRAWGG